MDNAKRAVVRKMHRKPMGKPTQNLNNSPGNSVTARHNIDAKLLEPNGKINEQLELTESRASHTDNTNKATHSKKKLNVEQLITIDRDDMKTKMRQGLHKKWANLGKLNSNPDQLKSKNAHRLSCTNEKCACKQLNDKQLNALQNEIIPKNEMFEKAFSML